MPVCKLVINRNFVNEKLEKLLYNHGRLVGRHPWPFIIIPLISTIALTLCVLNMKTEDALTMLTPTNSRGFQELHAFQYFFNTTNGWFYYILGIKAKDNGNLLRFGYRAEVLNLLDYFRRNYSIIDQNKTYSFTDLQVSFKNFQLIPEIPFRYDASKLPLHLSYPVAKMDGNNFYVGDSLRNVTVDPNTHLVTSIGTVFYPFISSNEDEPHLQLLKRWEVGSMDINCSEVSPLLNCYIWSEEVNNREIERHGPVAFPFVALGFTLLIIFGCLVTFSTDLSKCKSLEFAVGVLCILLSVGASVGIIVLMGFPVVSMLVIVPLLALALGIDVTFIILRNWQNSDSKQSTDLRLASTLSHSGISCIITMLTNLLSAAAGCNTNVPMVYIFNLCLTMTVSILFLLQMTLFAGFLVVGVKIETYAKQLLSKMNFKKYLDKVLDKKSCQEKNVTLAKGIDENTHILYYDWWCYFSRYISKFVCNKYVRMAVTLFLVIYWGTSLYCCSLVELGFELDKLHFTDSKMLPMIHLEKSLQLKNRTGRSLFIFVLNPPDLSAMENRKQMIDIAQRFETLPGCFGVDGTSIFLRDYENYAKFLDSDTDNETANFIDTLREYFDTSSGGNFFKDMVVFSVDNERVERFMFYTICFAGESWHDRKQSTKLWRDTADEFERFKVVAYFEANYMMVTDFLEALPVTLMQDLVVTSIILLAICVVFLPNVFNTLFSLVTVLSMNVGIFGFLTRWDVKLDPISIATFLLCIGYSVDFTLHIAYHYYNSRGDKVEDKIYAALSSIGLPMLETGFAMLLCVGCLAFVQNYLELVYVKALFLAIIIGLLHGLVILPTYLTCIPLNWLDKLFPGKSSQSS